MISRSVFIHFPVRLLFLCAADVLTIENSRSGDAMVSALAAAGYSKDLGPGVYYVVSFDHTGLYNGVIETDVTAEPMP